MKWIKILNIEMTKCDQISEIMSRSSEDVLLQVWDFVHNKFLGFNDMFNGTYAWSTKRKNEKEDANKFEMQLWIHVTITFVNYILQAI